MKRTFFIIVAVACLVAGCTAGDIEKTMQEYDARISELEKEVEELTVTLSDGSTVSTCTCSGHPEIAGHLVSIQEFGVLPTNTAEQNTEALQAAIDEAGKSGLALYVTPTENGYPMNGGLQLRRNVTLVGAQGPTGRGTANADRTGPTGSVFVIRDKENVFMTVTSATRVEGIQFYYPDQAWRSEDANKIIEYPPTIQLSHESGGQGMTLRDLTFYGEFFAMDFRAPAACEQILIENCYGYPLSGQFIAIDKCYDIPRILHCHINPANMREFGRGYPPSIIDKTIARGTYAYWIDHTDNAVVMDIFTFGTHGGIYLGANTYGQLTNFNFDCVKVGIYRNGTTAKNRTWEIAQGSIIANAGTDLGAIHPVYVTGGGGHTSLSNVECFSGGNGALTNSGASYDFITLAGSGYYTVSLTGCRMSGYSQDDPITVENPLAALRATNCLDKNDRFFDRTIEPKDDYPSGTVTVMDNCDSAAGWISGFGAAGATLDTGNQREGSGCITATGQAVNLFTKKFENPVTANVSVRRGHFCMKLYISDISAIDLAKEGSIEVTSGGTCDKEEFAWYIAKLNLKQGWNDLDLRLSEAGITGDSPDLSRMNYIRIYHLGVTKDLTIMLDDIRFYQE